MGVSPSMAVWDIIIQLTSEASMQIFPQLNRSFMLEVTSGGLQLEPAQSKVSPDSSGLVLSGVGNLKEWRVHNLFRLPLLQSGQSREKFPVRH